MKNVNNREEFREKEDFKKKEDFRNKESFKKREDFRKKEDSWKKENFKREEGFQKNDLVTLTIEDIGTEGEGIGKVSGFTLFVKDALPGDTVTAKIMKSKKTYAYGRLEKVVTPSPFRVEPPCAFHRQCGGCQLQALSYERQLEYKQQKITNNLIRIGGFSPEFIQDRMEPIVGMEEPLRYRNKAQYPVGTDREGNLITGFYAGRTHSIIANTNCLLGAPENQEILETILEYMRENGVSAYDETTGEGLVRHILIRKGFTSGELMVCVVINYRGNLSRGSRTSGVAQGSRVTRMVPEQSQGSRVTGMVPEMVPGVAPGMATGVVPEMVPEMAPGMVDGMATGMAPRMVTGTQEDQEHLPQQKRLIEKLSKIPGMKSISVNINTENTNVILGREVRTIWGEPTISDTIHVRDMQKEDYPLTGDSLDFKISPLSFYQVNPIQTEKLYSLALEYAGLTGKETVWDLYCGIGTISLFLARKAKQVCGVEIVEQAILDARENARCNGIENARFFVGKAEEVLPDFYAQGSRLRGGSDIQDDNRKGENGTQHSGSVGENLQADLAQGACPDDADFLRPDVIVVDPPRKGCDAACLDTMLKMQPARIVYVSCDSATLARDLRILSDGGYEVKRIRGVDQFAMTGHVECVVLMQYCGK